MIKLQDYKKNFRPHDVPDALAKLLAFDGTQDGFYSSGFELAVDDKGGLKTWSEDPEFLSCLYPIGQANGSGSTYVIWRRTGELSEAPVVVFGDEGGVYVVAENVAALLRILTFDVEPMVDHESVIYYKDDDHEPSDGAKAYVRWLAKHFDAKPVANAKEVTALVKAAQKLHAKAFKAWMKPFLAD